MELFSKFEQSLKKGLRSNLDWFFFQTWKVFAQNPLISKAIFYAIKSMLKNETVAKFCMQLAQIMKNDKNLPFTF